jgi:hypothetical protein
VGSVAMRRRAWSMRDVASGFMSGDAISLPNS